MTDPHDATGWTPENPYADEAKARWGDTDAYAQSRERVAKMTKEDFAAIGAEGDDITATLAALKNAGAAPDDPAVREQIERHWRWLGHFYEPNAEMYRGLGAMYVDDPRFAANYEKRAPGLAVFVRDAMFAYCDAETGR
jgi:hypothetical protein